MRLDRNVFDLGRSLLVQGYQEHSISICIDFVCLKSSLLLRPSVFVCYFSKYHAHPAHLLHAVKHSNIFRFSTGGCYKCLLFRSPDHRHSSYRDDPSRSGFSTFLVASTIGMTLSKKGSYSGLHRTRLCETIINRHGNIAKDLPH